MRSEVIYRNGQRCTVREIRRDVPLPATDEREVWHILRVDRRYELRAASSLESIGLTVYCPLLVRTVAYGRIAYDSEHALIPGYVFVALNPAVPQIGIVQTTGVIDFLRDPATRNRITVPESVMQALARHVGPVQALPATGARVKLRSGSLAGFFGSVEKAGPDLIRVILDTLGWKVTTSLDEVEILTA